MHDHFDSACNRFIMKTIVCIVVAISIAGIADTKVIQVDHAPIPGHNELFHGNKVKDEVQNVLDKIMEDSGMGAGMSRKFVDEYNPDLRLKIYHRKKEESQGSRRGKVQAKDSGSTPITKKDTHAGGLSSGGVYSHDFVHRDSFDSSQCETGWAIKGEESCRHAETLKDIVLGVLGFYMDFKDGADHASVRERPADKEDYSFCSTEMRLQMKCNLSFCHEESSSIDRKELLHFDKVVDYICTSDGQRITREMKESKCYNEETQVSQYYNMDKHCHSRFSIDKQHGDAGLILCGYYDKMVKCSTNAVNEFCGKAYKEFFEASFDLDTHTKREMGCQDGDTEQVVNWPEVSNMILAGYDRLDHSD